LIGDDLAGKFCGVLFLALVIFLLVQTAPVILG